MKKGALGRLFVFAACCYKGRTWCLFHGNLGGSGADQIQLRESATSMPPEVGELVDIKRGSGG